MKKGECTIYVMKGEKRINKFRKEETDWSLTIATGRVFPWACEQMVSHLLPSLAFGSRKGLTVKVVPDQERERDMTSLQTTCSLNCVAIGMDVSEVDGIF